MAEVKTKILLRNDTSANWATANPVLGKGEMGVEIDTGKFKFGDNVTEWNQLNYAVDLSTINLGSVTNHYREAESAAALPTTGNTVGDIGVVRTTIAGDAKSVTTYVWDGENWKATDGNYNAENVYFDEDMMVTKEVGYITLENGQGTIPSTGKNLKEVFEAIWVKEADPTKTDPSVTVTLSTTGGKEVGTTITGLSYTATYSDGNYQFGPDPTGADITKWEITSTAGYSNTVEPTEGNTTVASSLNSVALADLLVEDSTNFTVSAKATHTGGDVPKTNKGNDCADTTKQIVEGTKTGKSSAITGWRRMFMGPVAKDATVDSALIWGINSVASANRISAQVSISAQTFTAPAGTEKLLLAFPAKYTVSKQEYFTMSWETITDFVKVSDAIKVADKRGGDNGLADYEVWAYTPAGPLKADTQFRITLKIG